MASPRNDEALPASETTTLLSRDQSSSTEQAIGVVERRIVLFIFTLYFLLMVSAGLLGPSYTAALEERICHDAYPGLEFLDKKDCKSPLIQGKLATLSGWQYTMACIPSLFATVPYGMLSDKWGRSRVLTLALAGMFLGTGFQLSVLNIPAIPVEVTLLASLFELIGGGAGVMSAMVYTSLTDIVPVASRATVFMQLASLSIIADIISGALAGLILSKSIWAVLYISLGILFLITILSLLLPDTLSLVKDRRSTHVDNQDNRTSRTTLSPEANSFSVQETIKNALGALRTAYNFIYNHGKLTALMTAFVFSVLPRLVQSLLLQYATKRYGWSWGKASFLITIRSVVSLILMMIVLPGISYLLISKVKLPATRKDIWFARAMGIAGVIGALMIAFAKTSDVLIIGLVIIALNGGMSASIRSLLSTQVEAHHMGTLNSLIGVLDLVGVMIFAPVYYGSLRKGLEWGGEWIGLPFIFAALMLSVSTGIVFW